MAEKKKYYWLRLKRDFFKRHDITIIEAMENGKDYILFYLKLLCESVDHEGNLRFSEEIPYNDKMLSTITNTNIDIVRSAIEVFTKLGMMDIMDDGTYYMNGVEKMIGVAEQDDHTRESARLRAKAYRERKKQALLTQSDSVTSTSCDDNVIHHGEIEIDTEIDKKKNNKKEKPVRHKYGTYQNVLLSDEDMKKLKTEFPNDYEERIENVSDYCKSKGKTYSDYLATIRSWARKERKKNGQGDTSDPRKCEERERGIDEVIRRIESGEADHDDDHLWDGLS